MKNIAKKTIILYVLEILYKGSSKERLIKPKSIAKVINSMGVDVSTRTVLRNIQYLIAYGMPIYKGKNRNDGYYYEKSQDRFFGKNI